MIRRPQPGIWKAIRLGVKRAGTKTLGKAKTAAGVRRKKPRRLPVALKKEFRGSRAILRRHAAAMRDFRLAEQTYRQTVRRGPGTKGRVEWALELTLKEQEVERQAKDLEALEFGIFELNEFEKTERMGRLKRRVQAIMDKPPSLSRPDTKLRAFLDPRRPAKR